MTDRDEQTKPVACSGFLESVSPSFAALTALDADPRRLLRSDATVAPDNAGPLMSPRATTISTIAVKSGDTRIVIALLHSRNVLRLEVLELSPEITSLGKFSQEAQDFLQAHERVLQQIRSKTSPVEELLKQADEVITDQQPKAEVYAAMAESLGQAWADIMSLLELRRTILRQNVRFHLSKETLESLMNELIIKYETSLSPRSSDTRTPKEIVDIQEHEYKSVLEGFRDCLSFGAALLNSFRSIASRGNTIDSRPNVLEAGVEQGKHQIERWLEELHDLRARLDGVASHRKSLHERFSSLAGFDSELHFVRSWLNGTGYEYLNFCHLGQSSTEAENLLNDCENFFLLAKDVQDRCIRLIKMASDFSDVETDDGADATAKAYAALDEVTGITCHLDNMKPLLNEAILFFNEANAVSTTLCQLESEMKPQTPGKSSKGDGRSAIDDMVEAVAAIVQPLLDQGNSLLTTAENRGTEGISKTLKSIIHLGRTVSQLYSDHMRKNDLDQERLDSTKAAIQREKSWLENEVMKILDTNCNLGNDLPSARQFQQVHQTLHSSLMTKGTNIQALSSALPCILNGNRDEDAENEMRIVQETWRRLENIVSNRTDSSTTYTKCLSLFGEIDKDLDTMEKEVAELRENQISIGGKSDITPTIKRIEEKLINVQQTLLQAENTAKRFRDAWSKTEVHELDPHLNIQTACECIEAKCERANVRRNKLIRNLEASQNSVSLEQEEQKRWERLLREANSVLERAKQKERDMFPLLKEDVGDACVAISEIRIKFEKITTELRSISNEIDSLSRKADSIGLSGAVDPPMREKFLDDLRSAQTRLYEVANEYSALVTALVGFLNNIAELDRVKKNLQTNINDLPGDVAGIESMLKEHSSVVNTVKELDAMACHDAEQVVQKLLSQKIIVTTAVERDIKAINEFLRRHEGQWDAECSRRKLSLEKHLQVARFHSDLQLINMQLSTLSADLDKLKREYGTSLSAAEGASVAFGRFRETMRGVEESLISFLGAAEKIIEDQPDFKRHVQGEISCVEKLWAELSNRVGLTGAEIQLVIEYFKLINEIEFWIKKSSEMLLSIARKSALCKRPEDVNALLQEIDIHLSPTEKEQAERLKRLGELAAQLEAKGVLGSVRAQSLTHQHSDILKSFAHLNEELTSLASGLKPKPEPLPELVFKEEASLDTAPAPKIMKLEPPQPAATSTSQDTQTTDFSDASTSTTMTTSSFTSFQRTSVLESITERTIEQDDEKDKENEASETSAPKSDDKSTKTEVSELERRTKVESQLGQKKVAEQLKKQPQFTLPLHDAMLDEGSKFIFECRVVGSPTPAVTWFKDGMSIDNNPDYKTSYDKGTCSLTIEETFSEDSAKFTCKAVNEIGSAETSACLIVKETRRKEEIVPPQFVQELQPSRVKEGEPCQLECVVEGNPLPVVQWFKDNTCIDNSPDYVITYNNGACVLRFEEVLLEDQAAYTCRASNPMGSAESQAVLSVDALEPTEPPSFTNPLTNIITRAGQKLKLECSLQGTQPMKLSWVHNGREVREGHGSILTFNGQKASLIVAEAYPKDGGTYAIIAKNKAGEAASSCNVSVKGRLPVETSDSEMAGSDAESMKPSVKLPLVNAVAREGSRISLECSFSGSPEPQVTWYHGDVPITESPDSRVLFDGDRSVLVLSQCRETDAGNYKAIAKNGAGVASSSCFLEVTCPQRTALEESPLMVSTLSHEILEAPKFLSVLTDVKILKGSSLRLEGQVVGSPQPIVSWYRDGEELKPSRRMQYSVDSNGYIALVINDVKEDDSGVYVAKVSNPAGDAKCTSCVSVTPGAESSMSGTHPGGQARFDSTTKLMSQGKAPVFTQVFPDQKVKRGEKLKLHCSVAGDPNPEVVWLMNGEPLTTMANVGVSRDGNSYCLEIPEANEEFEGSLSCIAENGLGRATCVATITLEPELITTGEESPKPETQLDQIPLFNKSCYTSMTEERFVKTQALTLEPVTTLPEAKETFTATEFERIPVIPQPVTVPPKFVVPLEAVSAVDGQQVIFQGQVQGTPEPSIEWYKNGREFVLRNDMHLSYDGGKITLTIQKATPQDSGRYCCTAWNVAGSATSTADLNVQEPQIPPQFIGHLQAKMLKSGERLVLSVDVTGSPTPKVSWYLNDILLTPSANHREFRIEGKKHILTIPKATAADAGKYEVKAQNSAGEAHSVTDVDVKEQPSPILTPKSPNRSPEKSPKVSRPSSRIIPPEVGSYKADWLRGYSSKIHKTEITRAVEAYAKPNPPAALQTASLHVTHDPYASDPERYDRRARRPRRAEAEFLSKTLTKFTAGSDSEGEVPRMGPSKCPPPVPPKPSIFKYLSGYDRQIASDGEEPALPGPTWIARTVSHSMTQLTPDGVELGFSPVTSSVSTSKILQEQYSSTATSTIQSSPAQTLERSRQLKAAKRSNSVKELREILSRQVSEERSFKMKPAPEQIPGAVRLWPPGGVQVEVPIKPVPQQNPAKPVPAKAPETPKPVRPLADFPRYEPVSIKADTPLQDAISTDNEDSAGSAQRYHQRKTSMSLPRPKKFVPRASSSDGGYTSGEDRFSYKITPKWVPCGWDSDAEETQYRSVRPRIPPQGSKYTFGSRDDVTGSERSRLPSYRSPSYSSYKDEHTDTLGSSSSGQAEVRFESAIHERLSRKDTWTSSTSLEVPEQTPFKLSLPDITAKLEAMANEPVDDQPLSASGGQAHEPEVPRWFKSVKAPDSRTVSTEMLPTTDAADFLYREGIKPLASLTTKEVKKDETQSPYLTLPPREAVMASESSERKETTLFNSHAAWTSDTTTYHQKLGTPAEFGAVTSAVDRFGSKSSGFGIQLVPEPPPEIGYMPRRRQEYEREPEHPASDSASEAVDVPRVALVHLTPTLEQVKVDTKVTEPQEKIQPPVVEHKASVKGSPPTAPDSGEFDSPREQRTSSFAAQLTTAVPAPAETSVLASSAPPQASADDKPTSGCDLVYFKYDFGYEFGVLRPHEVASLPSAGNESGEGKVTVEITTSQLPRPSFAKPLPTEISIPTGMPVELECHLSDASKACTTTWYRNGHKLASTADHEIKVVNGICTLRIPQAYPEDAGVYKCSAMNNGGVAETSCSLVCPGIRR